MIETLLVIATLGWLGTALLLYGAVQTAGELLAENDALFDALESDYDCDDYAICGEEISSADKSESPTNPYISDNIARYDHLRKEGF